MYPVRQRPPGLDSCRRRQRPETGKPRRNRKRRPLSLFSAVEGSENSDNLALARVSGWFWSLRRSSDLVVLLLPKSSMASRTCRALSLSTEENRLNDVDPIGELNVCHKYLLAAA